MSTVNTGNRRCDCEHKGCHPDGDCQSTNVAPYRMFGIKQRLCPECEAKSKKLNDEEAHRRAWML